jgi:hypothetical protein
MEVPIPYPPNYVGGFLRPYYVAESIASRVLAVAVGEGLLCGSVLALRNLSDLPLSGQRGGRLLEARVGLLRAPEEPGSDINLVAPPAKVNAAAARRTPLHRSSPAAPDWAADYCVWQSLEAGPAGAAPELFVQPLGVGKEVGWDHALKAHLHFQVFERAGGGGAARGVRRPAAEGNRLVGQAVLRVCDLFAAASLPFLPSCSGLYALIGGEPEGDAPPRQEFFLRLWMPLSVRGGGGGGRAAAPGGGTRAALLVTLSMVLPRGVVVPAAALLPAPPPGLGAGSSAPSLGGGAGDGDGSHEPPALPLAGGAAEGEGGGEDESGRGCCGGGGEGGGGGAGGAAAAGAAPPPPPPLATAATTRPPRPFSAALPPRASGSGDGLSDSAGTGAASDGGAHRRPLSARSALPSAAPLRPPTPLRAAPLRIPIPHATVAAAKAAASANPKLAGYLSSLPPGVTPRRGRPLNAAQKTSASSDEGAAGGNPEPVASGAAAEGGGGVSARDPGGAAPTPRRALPLAAAPSPLPPPLGASALFSSGDGGARARAFSVAASARAPAFSASASGSARRVVRRSGGDGGSAPPAPESLSTWQVADAGEYLSGLKHTLAAMEKELSHVKLLVAKGVGAASRVAAYARYGEGGGGGDRRGGGGGTTTPLLPDRAVALQALAPQLLQRLELLHRAHASVCGRSAP